MDAETRHVGEVTAAAVAVMTAWADAPDDHGRLHALLVELAAGVQVPGPGVVAVPGVEVGLVNLCGVLLVELASELGCSPLEVLARHGESFARLAAGLDWPDGGG